jgi:hypothetical protein
LPNSSGELSCHVRPCPRHRDQLPGDASALNLRVNLWSYENEAIFSHTLPLIFSLIIQTSFAARRMTAMATRRRPYLAARERFLREPLTVCRQGGIHSCPNMQYFPHACFNRCTVGLTWAAFGETHVVPQRPHLSGKVLFCPLFCPLPDPGPDLTLPAMSFHRQRRYLSTGEVAAIVSKSVHFLYEQKVYVSCSKHPTVSMPPPVSRGFLPPNVACIQAPAKSIDDTHIVINILAPSRWWMTRSSRA